MLGIKTRLIKKFNKQNNNPKLSNDTKIIELMGFFKADEYGHEANTNKADLGYGWIHYGLLRQIKPKKVLCIGSRYGFIPAILAQACKDNGFGHVDFIDAGYGPKDKNSWTGEGFWNTTEGQSIFDTFELSNFITLFVTTTKKFCLKYREISYDYIYIDGDHSYSGVKLDYKLLWPKLTISGFMLFHDICVREEKTEGKYGVYKLWNELKLKKSQISINYLGSGLGIIQKQKTI